MLVNKNNNYNSYKIIYFFIYVRIVCKNKINSAQVLKYHCDVMMRRLFCREWVWSKTRSQAPKLTIYYALID